MTASKIRIYDLSRELGITNKDLMQFLETQCGVILKSHSSTVEPHLAEKARATFRPSAPESVRRPVSIVTSVYRRGELPPAATQSRPAPPPISPPAPKPAPAQAPAPPAAQATPPAITPTPAAPKAPPVAPAAQSPSMPSTTLTPPEVRTETPVEPPVAPRPAEPSRPEARQATPTTLPVDPIPLSKRPLGGIPPRTIPTTSGPLGVIRQAEGSGHRPNAPMATHKPPPPPTIQRPPASPHGGPPGRMGAPGGAPGGMGAPGRPAPTGDFRPGGGPPGRGPGGPGRPGPGGRPQRPDSRPSDRGGSHNSGRGRGSHQKSSPAAAVVEVAPPTSVVITDALTVGELAAKLVRKETEIIKHLFMKGMMVTVNQTLESNFAKTIAQELGVTVEEPVAAEKAAAVATVPDAQPKAERVLSENRIIRPPVVSIMGHVDHGKTSLLDAIRETRQRIVDTEAGGITQSIGAYVVQRDDHSIVFLDTPGHEAFTSMRMRGAQATDIAILVVAADDGVMPQTIEAINHAKAARIPIIVAVNKIDKAGADPEKVLVQLSEHGLVSEKWGGDTVTVEVSAIQKLGLDDLLEMIVLVSDLQELSADPTVPAEGVIIEAQLDKRKGPVATALVQAGTMRVGDNVLIGSVGGRVRALLNDIGERVADAGPSMPVEILGLSDVPKAGDLFKVIRDDREFKLQLATAREQERTDRLSQMTGPRSVGFAPRADGQEQAEQHQFNLIVKGDTQGSVEAVCQALLQLSTDEVQVKLIHSGTGDVSEADVMLASASQAVIIAFNVREDVNASRVSEQAGVKVLPFDVIYHLTEAVEKLMLGKLSPETQEVEVGQAEVRQIFTVGKNVVIAGCMVTKGKVVRNARCRVTRGTKLVYEGPLDNLKRFKDDAREVAAGYECGISFNRYNDLEIGDVVTAYTVEETERTSL